MQVVEVSESFRETWDRVVRGSPMGSFLQSWAWGDVQRAAGFRVTRLVMVSGGSDIRHPTSDILAGVCLLVERPLAFRRNYLVAPWGPVLQTAPTLTGTPDDGASALRVLTDALRERFGREAVFVRIEPRLSDGPEARHALAAHGLLSSPRNIQPKDTLVVDLTNSEDDLLHAMHPKTRYNIRVARRHGVLVEKRGDEGLRAFLALAREVERRGPFRYHPDAYYAAMARTLGPAGMLEILLATHRGVPLAAGLFIRFGDTVTYAHGASSAQHKHVMAPHLLHWEAMLRAKARSAARYDLFGIAPPGAKATHPWFGMTRFKQGFGGVEEHTVGTVDLVLDQALYRAYEISRNLRALLR